MKKQAKAGAIIFLAFSGHCRSRRLRVPRPLQARLRPNNGMRPSARVVHIRQWPGTVGDAGR